MDRMELIWDSPFFCLESRCLLRYSACKEPFHMTIASVSERGQISIPSAIRKKLGIRLKSKVSMEVGDHEITLRPIKSISDVEGIFHKVAKGKKASWDKAREAAAQVVAREVDGETKR
jgi:AbrB family looped-hinge helix DNA binding protein